MNPSRPTANMKAESDSLVWKVVSKLGLSLEMETIFSRLTVDLMMLKNTTKKARTISTEIIDPP